MARPRSPLHDRAMERTSSWSCVAGLSLLAACLATGLLGSLEPVSAQRAGRRARARDLGAELERMPLDACFESPDWVDSSTRVSLVVHPDGVWALALDGAVVEPRLESLAPGLRACVEQVVRTAWGDLVTPAPRRDEVHVRAFDFRVHHEDPSVRRNELRARFEASRADLARCVLDLPARRLDVVLRLGADGRVEAELPRPDVNRGLCITNTLGTFMPGAAVTLRVTVDAGAAPRVRQGGEGALCGWGERRGPPPADAEIYACAPGLQCCAAGGAAGSDSICMRATHCPAYP